MIACFDRGLIFQVDTVAPPAFATVIIKDTVFGLMGGRNNAQEEETYVRPGLEKISCDSSGAKNQTYWDTFQ
jgi:hypothetical protein